MDALGVRYVEGALRVGGRLGGACGEAQGSVRRDRPAGSVAPRANGRSAAPISRTLRRRHRPGGRRGAAPVRDRRRNAGGDQRREPLRRRAPAPPRAQRPRERGRRRVLRPRIDLPARARPERRDCARSEEHTSELQSLRHLVCRLLLEKKKKGKLMMIVKKKKKIIEKDN